MDCEDDITDNQSEYENTYIQPEEQSNTINDRQDINMDNSTDEALISEDDDNEELRQLYIDVETGRYKE